MTVYDADSYISQYVIDIEDWEQADSEKQERIFNVAKRTLETRFKKYTVPENAVYEFCATLATVFNDTNRLQQHGVAGFSVTGVTSFTFKENNVKTSGGLELTEFIPDRVFEMVGEANGVVLGRRRVGRSVR